MSTEIWVAFKLKEQFITFAIFTPYWEHSYTLLWEKIVFFIKLWKIEKSQQVPNMTAYG